MSSVHAATTDTDRHAGKGYKVGTLTNPRYVIDCSCGWQSKLHFSSFACKAEFAEHRGPQS